MAPLPADPEAIISAALDLREGGRSGEGVALLQAGVARYPRHVRLHQALGAFHRWREESAEAVAAFTAAAQLAPRDVAIAHALAQASLEAGYPAVAAFDRARRLAPADGELLIGRSAAQLAAGQGAQAIAELDQVTTANPGWAAGLETLAKLRWQAGDRADYLAGYRRAIAADPARAEPWLAMIDLQVQSSDYAGAAQTIAEARRAARIDLDAFEAVTASELGDVARADALFARFAEVPVIEMVVRHVRHLLRTGRHAAAAARAEPFLTHPQADQLWPYAFLVWRLVDDPRRRWIEDERLVGTYDLPESVPLGTLAERLRAIHVTQAGPIGQSVRHGTQTDGPLFARAEPEIRALRAAIADLVAEHIAALGPAQADHPVLRHARRQEVRFAGSWSVRLQGGGGRHSNHVHPQGWLSSACYIALPDDLGPAPAGHLTLGAPPAELGLDLPPLRTIAPQPGRLVLFPSMLWHGTMPFSGGERLSVAFDVARPA